MRVIDGDTVEIDGSRIRVFGIDAPETGQFCLDASGSRYDCAKVATHSLERLSANGLTCSGSERDDYGRLIAICLDSNGIDVAAMLVVNGRAWAFRRYSLKYDAQENEARIAKKGLWAANNQPAWIFRARRWQVAQQKSPNGCPIKGNISKAGKIYHTPWSRSYARTKITRSRGERWFCTEREALDAGWRAPLR